MASKVIVKMPIAPFNQVNKPKSGSVNGELVTVSRPPDQSNCGVEARKGPDAGRVAQLEQNIRFLQEQHQLMLSGLHHEIDNLRHRNRELQFQLVFSKSSIPSSPSSSSEEETKQKVYVSPTPVNTTPLQIELLEKDMGELKLNLKESESQNVYLSAIVDEQKKKLDRYERDRERERERAIQSDPELLRKLDDAEALIRRLRRENSDLRRDNTASTSNLSGGNYHQRESVYQRGGSNNQSRGRHRSNGGGHYRGNWFPPLHSQSYWQGGRSAERNGAVSEENTSLPSLKSGEPGQYRSRRGVNNNHYHNGDGRKYRGGQNRGPKPT